MRIFALMCSTIFGVAALAEAQTASPPPKPCTAPEARQFDFWLGDWTARFAGGDGKTVTGRNTVGTLYDGCVIVEQFDGAPGSPLKGMSHSVYDGNAKRWKQTWVDNSGGYLDFIGGWEGDRMILTRETERNGQRFQQRMVWFDISREAFNWHWERSDDGGKTWKVNWRIAYQRRQ
ncbi:MAG: hypothetical protein JNM76_00265 [Betaproteobacteria bacterium]|nr:hypothetical protein [Betaproteobacteria bacterium]